MRRLRRYSHARRRVLVAKFAGDTRYSDGGEVSSHDLVKMAAVPARSLVADIAPLLSGVDVVGIDEGQFYPDVVEFATAAADAGKVVIVAALDGDYRRKPFGRVLELIPVAERVDKLSAVCTGPGCARDAAFTKRTAASTQLQLVGAAEAYQPMCRECFASVPGADSAPAADAAVAAAAVKQPPSDADAVAATPISAKSAAAAAVGDKAGLAAAIASLSFADSPQQPGSLSSSPTNGSSSASPSLSGGSPSSSTSDPTPPSALSPLLAPSSGERRGFSATTTAAAVVSAV
jgi:thymidine kinase